MSTGADALSQELRDAIRAKHRLVEKMKEINDIANDFPHIKKGLHKVSIDPQPVLDAVASAGSGFCNSTSLFAF